MRGGCGRAIVVAVTEDTDDMLLALFPERVLLDVKAEVYAPLELRLVVEAVAVVLIESVDVVA